MTRTYYATVTENVPKEMPEGGGKHNLSQILSPIVYIIAQS